MSSVDLVSWLVFVMYFVAMAAMFIRQIRNSALELEHLRRETERHRDIWDREEMLDEKAKGTPNYRQQGLKPTRCQRCNRNCPHCAKEYKR